VGAVQVWCGCGVGVVERGELLKLQAYVA
jgi:hypothetical protein